MTDKDIQRVRELVKDARNESVTAERLVENDMGFGRYRLHDDPIYRLLDGDEKPEFLFHARSSTPEFNGPAAPEPIKRSRRHQIIHLITDRRWVIVAGNKDGDQLRTIALSDIEATAFRTAGRFSDSLSNNLFVFKIPGGHIRIPISNDYEEQDLVELSKYLRDSFGVIRGGTELDPEAAGYTIAGRDAIKYDKRDVRSRLDRLPSSADEEADQVLADSSDVDELISGLDVLIESHDVAAKRSLDDVIARTTTVEELRLELETPGERTRRQARDLANGRIMDAQSALARADPGQVGNWGLNVGLATRPLAVAAPGSTALWMAAALLLGGAAGVHASGVEGSQLPEIDPSELTAHVRAMAEKGEGLEHIDGDVAGALLGAFTYLGGRMAPAEFTKWVEPSILGEDTIAGRGLGEQIVVRAHEIVSPVSSGTTSVYS